MDPARVVRIVARDSSGTCRVGSGYLVRTGAVLTAAHVVAGADAAGVTVDLDVGGRAARHERALSLWWDLDTDLAVIQIPPGAQVEAELFGRVPRDRDAVVDAAAVGFPWWKRRETESELYRDSVRISGRIAAVSNRRSGTLELALTHGPDRDDDPQRSPWEGISGAAVFVNERVIGVVAEHHRPEGPLHLAVRPLTFAYDRLAPAELESLCRGLGLPRSQDQVGDVSLGGGDGGRRAALVCAPGSVPARDPAFVARPEVVDTAKDRLLAADRHDDLRALLLHGLPGAGKTSIAVALANDDEVVRQFTDGILWTTLGRDPDLLGALLGLVGELPEREAPPKTVAAASSLLRRALRGRAVLLVLDDVWDAADALPFLVIDGPSRALITTRRAHLADELKASVAEVPPMTQDQALTMLERRLGRVLPVSERAAALRAAEAVGFLPKALELAAARVRRARDGFGWSALVDALGGEIARLEALEGARARVRGESTLEAMVGLSLRTVRAEDEVAYRAFVDLGILIEDADITGRAAATLWQCSDQRAGDLLEWLSDEALLVRAPSIWTPDGILGAYRMHDVLRHVARRLLIASSDMGDALADAHRRLLDRYRACARQGLWHTLRPDGYIHQHLALHLQWAGTPEILHEILAEQTSDGRNGWYEVRERLRQSAGYVSDLARAEELAAPMQDGRHVALACRYALATSSLASLARSIPGALIARLVELDVWSPAQALAHVQRIAPRHAQNRVLKPLARHLPADLALRALGEPEPDAAGWDSVWAERAGWLVARLTPADRDGVLARVVDLLLLDEERLGNRSWDAPAILRRLSTTLLARLTDGAFGTSHPGHLLKNVRALAPHLTRADVERALRVVPGAELELAARLAALGDPERALEVVLDRDKEVRVAEGLSKIAPALHEHQLAPAMERARLCADEGMRTRALLALARRAGEFDPPGALRAANDALRRTAKTSRHEWWVRAMPAVGRFMPPGRLRDAVAGLLADRSRHDQETVDAFEALAPVMPKDLMLLCLDVLGDRVPLRVVEGPMPEDLVGHTRAILLRRLAEIGDSADALDRTSTIVDEEGRARALQAIAPQLGDAELTSAVTCAGRIVDPRHRANAIQGLSPHLPIDAALAALHLMRRVDDAAVRFEARAALAPCGPDDRFAGVLASIGEQERGRARLLRELAPDVPNACLSEALPLALELAREGNADALCALVPRLTDELWHEVLDWALAEPAVEGQCSIVAALAERVPAAAAADLERRVRNGIEPSQRGRILMAVAWRLAACDEVAHAVELTRELAAGPGAEPYQAAHTLAVIAPRVAGSALRDIAVLCKDLIAAVPYRAAETSCAVAKTLAEAGLVDEAFDLLDAAASAIAGLLAPQPDGSGPWAPPPIEGWAGALEAIAERLPPEKLGRVRDLALVRLSWSSDAETLVRTSPFVTPPFPPELVDEALDLGGAHLIRALPWLDSLVDPPRRDEVVRAVFGALFWTKHDAGRRPFDGPGMDLLGPLAPHLPVELVREALHNARAIAVASLGSSDSWHGPAALLGRAIELGDAPGALAAFRIISAHDGAAPWLAAVAHVLPDRLLPDMFRVALELRNPENRRAGLQGLAPRVAQLPRVEVSTLLAAVLANAPQRRRPELLADMAACGPLFVTLGGAELVGRIDEAIVDLGRWWP